jgi:hypothetical protein
MLNLKQEICGGLRTSTGPCCLRRVVRGRVAVLSGSCLRKQDFMNSQKE